VAAGKYDAELIAFCANIGRRRIEGARSESEEDRSSKCHIVTSRRSFARDFIFRLIQAARFTRASTFWERASRGRHCKGMIEIAAGGSRGFGPRRHRKGNDQVRFELTAAALAPN